MVQTTEFPQTQALIDVISADVGRALSSLPSMQDDPTEALRVAIGDRPWVLFAGAGLSVDPPASAPTFAALRDAACVAIVRQLVARDELSGPQGMAIEQAFAAVDGRTDISLPPELFFDSFTR